MIFISLVITILIIEFMIFNMQFSQKENKKLK